LDAIEEIEQAMTTLVRQSSQPRLYEEFVVRAGVRLRPGAYPALMEIARGEPIRLSDLANILEVEASSVSRHVKNLAERRLVARDGDPADGRAALLQLTAHGRDVVERLKAAERAVLVELLSGWSERDRAAFARLLSRFVSANQERRRSDLYGEAFG
jgi:DNA-binding MarR family transcriptional regulator